VRQLASEYAADIVERVVSPLQLSDMAIRATVGSPGNDLTRGFTSRSAEVVVVWLTIHLTERVVADRLERL